ncbi:hypothetical protein F4775DRAFT_544541 [Biscogniauxia sp. FL1348]|nr:hypothetical protein F4775DRAFT_544541 [Biscogniauxia sp. FL1348]
MVAMRDAFTLNLWIFLGCWLFDVLRCGCEGWLGVVGFLLPCLPTSSCCCFCLLILIHLALPTYICSYDFLSHLVINLLTFTLIKSSHLLSFVLSLTIILRSLRCLASCPSPLKLFSLFFSGHSLSERLLYLNYLILLDFFFLFCLLLAVQGSSLIPFCF